MTARVPGLGDVEAVTMVTGETKVIVTWPRGMYGHTPAKARELARQLEGFNLNRRDIEQGTLEEALELVGQRAGLNVELKSAEGTGEAVAALLRQYVAAGWPIDDPLTFPK